MNESLLRRFETAVNKFEKAVEKFTQNGQKSEPQSEIIECSLCDGSGGTSLSVCPSCKGAGSVRI